MPPQRALVEDVTEDPIGFLLISSTQRSVSEGPCFAALTVIWPKVACNGGGTLKRETGRAADIVERERE